MNYIFQLSADLGTRFLSQKQILVTAESCTGGGIAYAITSIPGSSQWFDCGFITYSNQSKSDILKIPEILIRQHGAVSIEVAAAMAKNALMISNGTIAIATTGIAGPDGATPKKPVGTVCFGLANNQQVYTDLQLFSGDRESIRKQSIEHALKMLIHFCN